MIKIKEITFGQYLRGKSVYHKMNPVFKIIITMINIISIFLANRLTSVCFVLIIVFTTMMLTGISLKYYFKGLKSLIIVILLTSLLNLFYGTGEPIFKLGFLSISLDGIINCIIVSMRIINLLIISSILTFTTTPSNITDGIEIVISPLKIFKVRVQDISMIMTIAIRFIPTLIEEANKIMMAQKLRGADIGKGSIKNRIKAMIPILIPLFVSSFKRAYDLAIAMECRCYNDGEGRTKMNKNSISYMDIVMMIFYVLASIFVILLNNTFVFGEI